MDGTTDGRLCDRVAALDPQAVAVALSAVVMLDVHKLHDGQALGTAGWDRLLAEAVEAHVTDMSAHGLSVTLKALCANRGDINRLNAVAAAIASSDAARAAGAAAGAAGGSEGGWRRVVRAIENEASSMSEHDINVALHALSRLKPLESAMSSDGWSALARRLDTLLPTMRALHLVSVLRSVSLLPGVVVELAEPEVGSSPITHTHTHSERKRFAFIKIF